MRKITIIIALLAIVSCQETVVKHWTGHYDSGMQFQKTYQDWGSYTDLAVSGWMRINPDLPRSEYSTIFHLTSNDKDFSDYKKEGDRVLSFFIIKNLLHTPTYTKGKSNLYNKDDPQFQDSDLGQWFFFYVGYSQEFKRTYSFFGLPSGSKTSILENVIHNTSSFYRIFVGQSANFKYFPGSLYNVMIHTGPDAYRESGHINLSKFNPNLCPAVFTECDHQGYIEPVCEQDDQRYFNNINYVKSVYVPSEGKLTQYDEVYYPDNIFTFTKSIDCITLEKWSSLVKSGDIVVKPRNQNQKQLRRL